MLHRTPSEANKRLILRQAGCPAFCRHSEDHLLRNSQREEEHVVRKSLMVMFRMAVPQSLYNLFDEQVEYEAKANGRSEWRCDCAARIRSTMLHQFSAALSGVGRRQTLWNVSARGTARRHRCQAVRQYATDGNHRGGAHRNKAPPRGCGEASRRSGGRRRLSERF